MSAFYRAVNWNRQKYIFDGVLLAGIVGYLALFTGVSLARDPQATLETALIRGLGTAALVLLTLILVLGPLSRRDPRWLPLLYNRRHLGVAMCLLGLAHASFAVIQFHALGDVNPFVSLLTAAAWPRPDAFPFELLGLAALLILLLMAATSHDFWLSFLSPPWWKALHMLVYVAYGLLAAHVALGSLQQGADLPGVALVLLAVPGVFLLQLVAGLRERRRDRVEAPRVPDGWVDVGPVDTIAEGRARMAVVGGERIAVFRYDGKVSCVSNVCRHQNGPLAEGRIVDGCITCPWHGYQYLPDSGSSPPPFTETIPTYDVRVSAGRVLVNPEPHPPGTRVEPARITPDVPAPADDEPFYVGYHPMAPGPLGRAVRARVLGVLALLAAVAVLLAASQEKAGPGVFEYGHPRAVAGELRLRPYPALYVPATGGDARERAYTRYLLVAAGKHGADALVQGHDGAWVELSGTRIARAGLEMLEVEAGSVHDAPAAGPGLASLLPPPAAPVEATLTGEIVDAKCWLGVMKPARHTVHRGCATRCVSGGIPPLLMVTDDDGNVSHVLLTGADGGPAPVWFRELVGIRVRLTGSLVGDPDLPRLAVREAVVAGDAAAAEPAPPETALLGGR